jgi:hypothetical protein
VRGSWFGHNGLADTSDYRRYAMADKEQESVWETLEGVLPQYSGFEYVVQEVDKILKVCTGLNDYERKLVAYYAIATYYINQYSVFPGLLLYGGSATGKSQVLDLLERTCYKVARLTEEASTAAALKAVMKEVSGGVLILEEAGEITTRALEGILASRYGKSTALTAKMVRGDEKDYELELMPTYGATVVHREFSVRKLSLQRRLIEIHTYRVKGKEFTKFLDINLKDDGIDLEAFIKGTHDHLAKLPELPRVRIPSGGVESGVFDTYAPVIAVATALEDFGFIEEAIREMEDKSAELRDSGTAEVLPTILRAILLLVHEDYGDWTSKKVDIPVSNIEPTIRREFGGDHQALLLSHNQRNRIIRQDFHFVVRSSGGKQRVYLTLDMLITACDRYGVQDEVIELWRGQGVYG